MGKHNAKKSGTHLIILIIFIIIAIGAAGVVYFFNKNKQKEENIKAVQQESAQPEQATATEKTALEIMKEYWGEDDQVYFTLDSQNGDDYVIAVREAETTKAIDFYNVNIKTKEVKLQE